MMRLEKTTREAALAFALLPFSAFAHADMALHVTPKHRLFTDPAHVTVSGAPAGAEVTIEATLTDRGGQAWTSRGVFYADLSGQVDLSRDASVFGTYKGIDGEAIFWSMQPATSEQLSAAGSKMDDIDSPRRYPDFDAFNATYDLRNAPVEVTLNARVTGILAESYKQAATARQAVVLVDKAVQRVVVSEGDMHGVIYEAPGKGPHPLAVVVTGSTGGINELKAMSLANEGITTFALAHFNYPGRPTSLMSIPLEYFEDALAWFAGRYGQKRVALLGDSRGGEGVLLIASSFPDQVSALIPGVPSNMVYAGVDISTMEHGPAWSLDGEPLPYFDWKFTDLAPSHLWPVSGEARHIYLETMLTPGLDDPRWIEVENIRSPILLISGDADAVWPSDIASERIVARLQAKAFEYPVKHLEYRGAGHLVIIPALVKSRGEFAEAVVPGVPGLTIGGTPARNAHAQTDAFRKTVDFIKHHESAED